MAEKLSTATPVEASPAIGHNAIANLAEVLQEVYAGFERDVNDMLTKIVEKAPREIGDDKASGVVSDLIKEADDLMKLKEKYRTSEVAPFLAGQRTCNGHFNGVVSQLDETLRRLQSMSTAYMRRKQQEADAKAERERREARQREEDARRKAIEAQNAADEARRKAEAARKPANREAANVQVEGFQSIADRAAGEAAQHAQEAEEARKRLEAKPAEKGRTRGESSLSTLRGVPAFEVLQWERIPLEELRPYLERAAIEKAIKGFQKSRGDSVYVDDGTTTLAGVRFFRDAKGTWR